ncbi:hypothetical protein BDV3_005424 [Batrachochytrium dendrobatidis]
MTTRATLSDIRNNLTLSKSNISNNVIGESQETSQSGQQLGSAQTLRVQLDESSASGLQIPIQASTKEKIGVKPYQQKQLEDSKSGSPNRKTFKKDHSNTHTASDTYNEVQIVIEKSMPDFKPLLNQEEPGRLAPSQKQHHSDSKSKQSKARLSSLDSTKPGRPIQLTPIQSQDTALQQPPQINLSINSVIQDFKRFQGSQQHPGTILNIITSEDDPVVYTEFDILCNNLIQVLSNLETSIEDVTAWKNDFLKQSVPSDVKLELTLLFSKLYRSKSDFHQPFFDLVKAVKMYSRPWGDKRNALLKLQTEHQQHHHVLDIVIRKLENMHIQMNRTKVHHRLALWERLMSKLIMHQESEQLSLINDENGQIINRIGTTSANLESNSNTLHENSHGRQFSPQSNICLTKSKQDRQFLITEEAHAKEIALLKLKSTIQLYATNEPEWLIHVRTLLKRFKLHLKKTFPGLKNILSQILKRPFPVPGPSMNYISTKTGTIMFKQPSFPRPRSYSCNDFKLLHMHYQNIDDMIDNVTTTDAMCDMLMDDADGKKTPDQSRQKSIKSTLFGTAKKNLRCNSLNTLIDLGKRAHLRKPFTRNRLNHSNHSSQNDVDENEFDYESEDEISEASAHSANYSDLDKKYFQRFRDEDIQNIVNTFMDNHSTYTSHTVENNALGSGKQTKVDVFQNLDADKEFFSMQEVIELTLLHAQQMHIMQSEYNERINHMTLQLDQAQKDQEDLNTEWEKRYMTIQEQLQKMALYYTNQARSGVPSNSGENVHTPQTKQFNTDMIRNLITTPAKRDCISFRRNTMPEDYDDSSELRLDQLQARLEHRKLVSLAKRTQSIKSKVRELPARRLPRFTSTPMAMGFMERLYWFTEMSLKKRAESKLKVTEMEKAANEQKLAYLQRMDRNDIESTNGMLTETNGLLAEFMPMPGTVTGSKQHRDIWADQGILSPWGGRFKIQTSKQLGGKKINVLNLFDVAMNIPVESLPKNNGK